MKVLVTGGCGYIGSHTIVELLARGHVVKSIDNLCNASALALTHVHRITRIPVQNVEADLRDYDALCDVFADFGPQVVIHFAALKAVGESWQQPLDYFDNNIHGTIALLRAMQATGVGWLVFSSSATVYGDPDRCPIPETAALRITNPYGRTKLVMEQLIGDLGAAKPSFHAAVLRYFNPVGAHPSGELGEDPAGVPANLMPYVCQVACGRQPYLNVFGHDYPTPDGTGVRDYIHVMDLARAHADAIDALEAHNTGFTVNLGTGRGYSVLEVVSAFEAASGRHIPLKFKPRRAGDIATCYADPSLAKDILGWNAQLGLARMCEDAWRWQSRYPQGYATANA